MFLIMAKSQTIFLKRFVYAFLIILLVIPAFALTFYGKMPGRIIGMIIFMALAILGVYEVAVLMTKNITFIIMFGLILIIGVFFLPFQNFLKIIEDGSTSRISLREQIFYNFRSYQTFLLPPFAVILFIICDKNLRINFSILIRNFLILTTTSFLASFLAKGLWVINIFDWARAIFVITIASFSDTFAYLGGMLFGKKLFKGAKLAPRISPSKTWAGAIISFVLTSLFTALVSYYIHFWDGVNNWIVMSIVGGIFLAFFAQIGDLLFSGFKRVLKVKDFSSLIPIHGGIFDRVDASSMVMFWTIILFILIA